MKKFWNSLSKIILAIILSAGILAVGHFGSAATDDLAGLGYAEGTGLGNADPQVVIARIIQIFLGFLGIIALSIILYAGFLWMTSEGNEEKIAKAKAMLKNAAIGIGIIFSAFAIVSFILNALIDGQGGSSEDDGSGGGYGGSIGALGNGIIKSVYPEPNQKEVPRNTSIIVTFREKMDPKTICQTSTGKCEGQDIVKENVRLFQTAKKDSCRQEDGETIDCEKTNIIGVKAFSKDNETFVFSPSAYLGSPTEYIWHSVALSNGIKKADGGDAFKSFKTGYEWQFEVSSKLDLIPPRVLDGGVFPAPDDQQDVIGSSVAAVAAAGKIEVKAQPQTYQARSVSVPVPAGTSGAATVSGSYNCQADGTISVSITGGLKVSASGVEGLTSGDDVADGKASIGCGLVLNGNFSAGNAWTLSAVQEKQADILSIGSANYAFVDGLPAAGEIQRGATLGATAANIKNTFNSNAVLNAAVSGTTVNLTAKTAGASGNNISLSTSNTGALNITAMSGGKDKADSSTVKGKSDKPKNAVIQINFDEAVNPLNVSGKSDEVKDYIRIVNKSDNNKVLSGTFAISNQYKTVEFISDVECGVNACGEKIYCLPGNSNLSVELAAAHLQPCGSDTDCSGKNPYSKCAANCQDVSDPAKPKNYPGSSQAMDGIVDVCSNSLDGNRDQNAQGPASFFEENAPAQDKGDSYRWSFWISDKLDLTAPTILSTDAGNGGVNVDLYRPISVKFDKVMMSSRLTTGSVTVNNGQENVVHQLMNIRSFTNSPVGYWMTNEGIDTSPADGEAESTVGYINHTEFGDSTRYRSQAGSGIRDIYQNCYKPCAGSACSGIDNNNPSCCSGAARPAETCP